ncbi:MAG: hypothetical protein PHV34_00735 [Verrucomicrobiae bacterium]|nr:hypothetical protein [Verrucomicrobiae bacterium]
MDDSLLLSPPVAFLIILAASGVLSLVLSRLSVRPAKVAPGTTKAYACGENVKQHRARPEYGQFFHFAFFFTIMHVIALVVTTAPNGGLGLAALAGLYLLISAVGLLILYRR